MPYRERLRRYVIGAAVISACVLVLCIITGQPWLAILYAYPVALLAVLFGMRAGFAAGTLATGLTVLGGELGGQPPDAPVYVGVGTLLLLLGGVSGLAGQAPRQPAAADAEESPTFLRSLHKILLGLLVLIDVVTVVGGVSVPTSAPSSQSSPAVEYRVGMEAKTSSAQRSSHAALMDAFSGSLTSQRFQLDDVDPWHQVGYREALLGLNALLVEPSVDRVEALEIAAGLEAAVASGRVEALAVVATLDACRDPLLGMRAVACYLGTMPAPLLEVAEELEEFAELVEWAGEVVEFLEGEKKRARRARRTGSPPT